MSMEWRFFILVAALCVSVSNGTELNTKKGLIKGSSGISRNGQNYRSFKAIPYAMPPVGDRRFKNPEPHSGWEGVLDATNEATPCMQVLLYVPHERNKTLGQEDCLYLNIFTPRINENNKLPVMVYIHGGGFKSGAPHPKNSEIFFMDEDVVLVTIQYRLGTLGFLSTEDSIIPGNYGLKDQAMALKWLKNNVDDYGGNPNAIVAFGESAGGASVHYLATSPISRDLLAGGISISGVIDAPWAFAPHGRAKKFARKVINMVGCDSSPLLKCLQSLPAENLIKIESEFIEWDFDPVVAFQPVVEERKDGAFMVDDPRTVKVTLPWITGISGEAAMKSASLMNQDSSVLDYFVENINKVLPALLFVDPNAPGLDKLLTLVKNRYFYSLDQNDDKHTLLLKQHEKFFFELYFAYPMKKALDRHTGPKYAYLFSHRAETTMADLMGPIKRNASRTSHGDELINLFDLSSYFPNAKIRPADEKFSKYFVKLWVDFAKSLSSRDNSFEKQWSKYVKDNMLHFTIVESKMEQILLDTFVDFWSHAYGVIKPTIWKDEL